VKDEKTAVVGKVSGILGFLICDCGLRPIAAIGAYAPEGFWILKNRQMSRKRFFPGLNDLISSQSFAGGDKPPPLQASLSALNVVAGFIPAC